MHEIIIYFNYTSTLCLCISYSRARLATVYSTSKSLTSLALLLLKYKKKSKRSRHSAQLFSSKYSSHHQGLPPIRIIRKSTQYHQSNYWGQSASVAHWFFVWVFPHQEKISSQIGHQLNQTGWFNKLDPQNSNCNISSHQWIDKRTQAAFSRFLETWGIRQYRIRTIQTRSVPYLLSM